MLAANTKAVSLLFISFSEKLNFIIWREMGKGYLRTPIICIFTLELFSFSSQDVLFYCVLPVKNF
jgi:hypothetical protein